MDFHGMKRKDLQTLCKKHGIPANLKNIEMANRLAFFSEKETVNLPEDSVEADVFVSKEAKRVRFSPQNEVFEFTRSVVEKCHRKNVSMSSQGLALEQGGVEIELRRSKRIVAKGITVARPVTKALKVKRSGSSGSTQKDCKVSDFMAVEQFGFEDVSEGLEKTGTRSTRLKAKTLLHVKRSQRLVDTKNNEDELVKCNLKDLSMDVQVEKVSRRSSQFVNDIDVPTNTQNRRRSIRLKARAANSSMGGETSDGVPLCSAKEGKKETKSKQSEGSTVAKSHEGKESLIDCKVRTTKSYGRMKLQDVSKVEKVPRRSKRCMKDINVLMDRHVKAAKRVKSLIELLVDGQGQKGDEELKRTFVNDREGKKFLRSSVIDCEPDGASVDNVKKSKVRLARNSLRHDSSEAPIVVEENLVEKKTDETLEKAGGTNVGSGGSSKKPKTVNQECVTDKPQEIHKTPSSEAKAAESVMVIENVLDSTPEKPLDSSQRTNTQELNSELVEGKREEKLEHDAILMPVIEGDKEEVSPLPVLLIERLSPTSVQLSVSNPEAELVVLSSHNLVKDIAPTAIAEENIKSKENNLICTPRYELKECSSVSKLAKAEEILENSAECWKEINPSKDDEKGSLENKVHQKNSAEEEVEITKNGYVSVGPFVNLTPEKLLDEYSQLKPEEVSCGNVEAKCSSMGMKTGTQELVKDHPQGISEKDSPSTSETKATEPVMISENVLDSTLKSSVDIALVRSTQELDSELLEEKHEQDTVLMAAGKEKDGASSLSVFLIEHSEVSNPEVELFVETTPSLASVQLKVSNHEVELGVPTAHMLVKDIASTVITNEDIKTKEEIPIELKEHSFVAKLAEAEAILENSAEIHSSKDDVKGSLEKKMQAETTHGNFSEYTEYRVGHSGNLVSLEKTISCESGCKLNELEQRRWSSTDSTSLSPKEDNVSKCFEEDEIKALSQPLHSNKDVTVFDESAIFTTPERNLMMMEHVSENGKTPAADSVTYHKDEAVESHVVVFTTPRIVEAGKEEDGTSTNFPDESDAPTTTESYSMLEGSRQTEARNEGESKPLADSELGEAGWQEIKSADKSGLFTSLETRLVFGDSEQKKAVKTGEREDAEFCDASDVPSIPENSELDEAAKSEEDKVVELQVDSGIFTSAEKHLLLETDEEMKGDNMTANSHVVLDVFIASESQSHMGEFEPNEAEKTNRENMNAETIMEAKRNVLCGSNILALPIEGNFQTVGETSSYLEVDGTCSMVSESGRLSTDVQNQIHDAKEELALTDNTEADELIEVGGSYDSGKTCVLAGAEGEHLSLNSEVDFRNSCEKSLPKFLKDEAADSVATAFEKAISVTSEEFTVQNNMNEKDEEMIRRETTKSPEETLHDSSENKEYLNIDESGEKQRVRREPILIYRTQVKLKRHDMKENAPNSKIVDNLNVTAPKTSKRQPLQDLRSN